MSRILKTEAIPLRISPFSRTSHVVTWMTAGYGRLATTIKGAVRPKSTYLGQYDLYTSCELLFYERERGELHYIKECSALHHRTALRHDWRGAVIASYISDILLRLGPARSTDPCLFSYLSEVLNVLERDGGHSAHLVYAETKLLRRLGLTPRVDCCVVCETGILDTTASGGFSCSHGGILCHTCAREYHMEAVASSPETAQTLQRWCGGSPQWPGPFQSPAVEREMIRIMGLFLRYHLDLQLLSRDIAIRTLTSLAPQRA